jgi:hypothetical protein
LIERHARRLAQLGVNLVRLTHVDSNWVRPNLIAPGPTTNKLDDKALDALFHWVKALKDQGIYVWVDMIDYRPFLKGDGGRMDPIRVDAPSGIYNIALPADKGTHFFLLEAQ